MRFKTVNATVVVAILLVGLLVTSVRAFALPTQEIIDKARISTVLIVSANEENPIGGGIGSGVLIEGQGTILTNYHVIHRAETLKVWFYDLEDHNHYPAEVVGIDPAADLALLRLDPKFLEIREVKALPHLEIESRIPPVGLSVTAHGHMLGHQWSVTQGILNHVERPGKITPYVNILQHTALINQGNSGGPLVTDEGKIIGINTYILMPRGKFVGIGYAIRGDTIRYSVDQMLEHGEVKRPAFKANFGSLHTFLAKELTKKHPNYIIPNTLGMIAQDIKEGDYAYEKGLRLLDTLVLMDGHPINSMADIKDLMLKYKPGDVVKLLIIRHRMYMLLDYELGTLEFPYLEFYDKRVQEQFGQKSP